MRKRNIFWLAVVLALPGLLIWLWFSPAGVFAVPPLTVNTLDGRSLDLQALHGKPFLVTFWATNCPSCIAEMPALVDLYKEFSPQGFELIGVATSYSPPDHVIQMVKNKQLSYPIVLDISGDVARAFADVSLTPTHFLVSPTGMIVKYKIGMLDMPKLRKEIRGMLDIT